MSRRLGEQGRVVLNVYILADGTVGEVKIKQSSGFSRLDDAALQAVKNGVIKQRDVASKRLIFGMYNRCLFSLNP
ncbi:MAG: energy transducer TonB [Moraxellaceae bacterium]|nr:energy transducer TonB [Moraxellaceae bacterium]